MDLCSREGSGVCAGGRDLERAWAAGYFDGEGSTSTTHAGHGFHLTVSSIERENLERFQAALDGVGNIGGPYQKATNRKPIYCYRLYGMAATREALMKMWPYLSEAKRAQAGRAAIRSKTRVLKRKVKA